MACATKQNETGQRRSFIKRQVLGIAAGGLTRFVTKTIPFFFMLALATMTLILVRAISPLVKIRFSPMHSSHIGAFAANTELYLCEKTAGLHGKRIIDIFYHFYGHSGTGAINEKACNQQLKKMWDRQLHVSTFARWLDRVNSHLPLAEAHQISWRSHLGDADYHGVIATSAPHLSFTAQEEAFGRECLNKLGIPEGAEFVCFHARDSAYLKSIFPDRNWEFQNYRDSNILNYLPAVQHLTDQGYYAIRMGGPVESPLPDLGPKIIDYASESRTDFQDIYLSARCNFFLSSNSGIDAVPRIFRRPVTYVNFAHAIPIYLLGCAQGSVLIPKKIWLTDEQRYMTLTEIINEDENLVKRVQNSEMDGYFIENTADEILAVVAETNQRLKGTWVTTDEDKELQRRFWELFDISRFNGRIPVHIGAHFLRENQQWLV